MTENESFVHVSYNGKLLFVRFPKNNEIKSLVKRNTSAYWDSEEFCWVVPKEKYSILMKNLSPFITLRSKEDRNKLVDRFKIKEESFQDVMEKIPKNVDVSFINGELYNFQKLSVAWASTKKSKRADIFGGILGDEPGLGKTIQSLAIALFFKHNPSLLPKPIKRVLIVCPSPVKIQWAQEINRFTNENSIVIQGKINKNSKKAYMHRVKQYEQVREENIFFTIVNYELLREKIRLGTRKKRVNGTSVNKVIKGDYIDLNEIKKNEYDLIILDEAHRIGNPETDLSTAIREIQSPFIRLGLTGTPIEKDVEGIFQLADYIAPGLLSNLPDFWSRWNEFTENFLVREVNHFIKFGNPWEIRGKGKNLAFLKMLLAPIILRRLTSEVSDELPDLRIDLMVSEWEEMQEKLYNFLLEKRREIKLRLDTVKDQEQANKLSILHKSYGTYLKRVCDHPKLLQMTPSGRKRLQAFFKQEKIKKSVDDYVFAEPERLTRLKEDILNNINSPNGKWVIFSQYEDMITILEEELSKSLSKTPFKIVKYIGSTPEGCKYQDVRKANEPSFIGCDVCPFNQECDTRTKKTWYFQNDKDTKIIILSDAGNYGINLHSGANLYHYDLPDRISTFIQRIGRIRRLGSKHKRVFVKIASTPNGVDFHQYKNLKKQEKVIKKLIDKTSSEQIALNNATFDFDELEKNL